MNRNRLWAGLTTLLDRNRPDRFAPLIGHLRRHGADLALTRRAMHDRQVDPALRQHVIDQLEPGVTGDR